ncbi:MAG: FKBP-type peptidyl-prolyl cis-trans isomerase [Nannocystaceae bacterium]
MQIEPRTIVTLAYDLCTEQGEIIESSDLSGPITFMQGTRAMIPGLDAKLIGLEVGVEASFEFPPGEAFGNVEDSPTKKIGRTEFPAKLDIQLGMRFEADLPGGQSITLAVEDVTEAEVTVRMLHPLAGKKIKMDIKVLKARPPTSQERDAGRAILKPPVPPPKPAS